MPRTFDWVIRNGRIIDGTGNPWYQSDIALHSGKVAAIGRLTDAKGIREIDAEGKFVCPGFIDAHSHSDTIILNDPVNLPKLSQGITTEVIGQDGISFLPLSARTACLVDEVWRGINGHNPTDQSINTFAGLIERIDKRVSANYVFLVPHATVRMEVMGTAQRAATEEELYSMEMWIRRLMEDGAAGVSTGLTYWPEACTPTEELVRLCRIAGSKGGIYVTHLRDYDDNILSAIDEAISIARLASIPVHISHLTYDDERIVEKIDAARSQGLDITFDLYPYLAGNTLLAQFLPRSIYASSITETVRRLRTREMRDEIKRFAAESGIKWGNLLLSGVDTLGGMTIAGMMVNDAAALHGKDIVDFICALLVETRLAATVIEFSEHRSEAGLKRLIDHPAQMFCTDAILVGSHLHPRSHGTYPRILARYISPQGSLRIEEAVRKMTSFPAQRYGINDRGLLKPGIAGDMVIFDPQRICDLADYQAGSRFSTGIEYVWVNGALVLEPAGPTGITPGRVIRLNNVSQ